MKFFREYCLSIVEIIETKQSFVTPLYSYYILIIVFFSQVAGYILSTYEIKPLNEEVIYTVGTLAEESTGTFLLFISGIDGLTIIFFIMIDTMMLFYFSYVACFTYFKLHQPQVLAKVAQSFNTINQALNQFFTAFWWVFFTPLIEINSGMMVVGGNSFLTQFRTSSDLSQKPFWQILLAFFGLVMTNVSGVILLYCFRNYEFEEQNLLKRRFHIIQIIILFLRFFLIYFYYLNLTIIIPIKHLIAHFIGIAIVFDFYLNIPIQNIKIAKFFIISFVTYEILMIASSLWMFTFDLPDNEMFYFVALLTVLCCPIMLRLYEIRMHSFMQLTFKNYDKIDHHHLDSSLENLLGMFRHSNKDKLQKIQFLLYMKFHIQNCVDVKCNCHTFTIQKSDSNRRLKNKGKPSYKYGISMDIAQLIQVINVATNEQFCELQFKRAITEECVLINQELFEHYQIKLISFIAKYKDNSTLSYFELKKLLARNTKVSFFFQLVSQVYAGVLQKQIELYGQGDKVTIKYDLSDKGSEHLIELTQTLDIMYQQTSEFIQFIVKLKLDFWNQASQISLDDYSYKQAIVKTVQQILSEFVTIETKIKQIEQKYSKRLLESHVLYQRMQEMIECYVYNNQNKVLSSKKEIIELKKKDYFKPQIYINNYNLQQGQVVHLQVEYSNYSQIGISNNFGEILKCSNNNVLAKFFGYSLNEIEHIKSINTFMPKFIAEYHNIMMVDFLQNINTTILTQTRQVYLRDKEKFIFPASIDIRNTFGYNANMVYFVTLLKHQNANQFILLDDSGYFIGMSLQIFKYMFQQQFKTNQHNSMQNKDQERQEFYQFLLKFAPFQLICPDFLEVMNKIKEIISAIDTQFTNVTNHTILNEATAKIIISSSFKDHVQSYIDLVNKKFHGIQKSQYSSNRSRDQSYSSRNSTLDQPSLLKKSDLHFMKEIVTRLSQSHDKETVLQIKFKLHLTYKSFENADMTLIQSEPPRIRYLRYFIIEITDFIILDQFQHEGTSNSKEFYSSPVVVDNSQIQSPIEIQIYPDIDNNLSSIQGDGGFTVASEIINEELQILTVLEGGFGFGENPFPLQISQKIVDESIMLELEDLKNVDKIAPNMNPQQKDITIIHTNKRQQFKPLVFLKNQILVEDTPQFDDDDHVKSNLVSPRQTARPLISPVAEPIEEEKSEIIHEVQLFTPKNHEKKKINFQSQDKIASNTQKEKTNKQSVMQSKTSSLSKLQVYHMIENIYQSGDKQPKAIKRILSLNLIQILILVTGLITMIQMPMSMYELVLRQSEILFCPQQLIQSYNEGYIGAINLFLNNQSHFELTLANYYIFQSKTNLNNILFNDTTTLLDSMGHINQPNQTSFNLNIIDNQQIYQQRSNIFDFLASIVQQINSISDTQKSDKIEKSSADLIINYPIFQTILQDIFYSLLQNLDESLRNLRNNMILIPIAFILVQYFSQLIIQVFALVLVIILYFQKQVITYEHKIVMILGKLQKFEIDKIVKTLRSVLDDYNISRSINIVTEANHDKTILQSQDDEQDQKAQHGLNKKKPKKNHDSLSRNSKSSFNLPKSLIYIIIFGSLGIIMFVCFIPFYQTNVSLTQNSIQTIQKTFGIQNSLNKLVFSSQMLLVNKIIQRTLEKGEKSKNLRILSDIYQNQSNYWKNSFQEELELSGQSILYLSILEITTPGIILTSSSLCAVLNSTSIRQQQIYDQICGSKSIVYLRKGLIDTFTNLIQFYIDNLQLIYGNSTIGIDDLIKEQAYQSLLQEYYAVISYQFNQIINMQQNQQVNSELQFESQLQIFSLIIGGICIVISILLLIMYHRIQLQQINNLKFALTLLPQEKLEDQTIMFMLKTLAQQ